MFNSSNTCLNEQNIPLLNYGLCPAEDLLPLAQKGHDTTNSSFHCHDMGKFNATDYTSVVLMNATQLLAHLSSHSAGMCSIVLFYAVWCPFSMQMASSYNAVGRIFSGIPIIAVDVVSQFAGFTSSPLKSGTASVPNVIVFNGGRPVGRYNGSKTDLNSLIKFLGNFMDLDDMQDNSCVYDNSTLDKDYCSANRYSVLKQDYLGPVPVEYKGGTDYLLYFSFVFLVFVFCLKCKR